MKRNGRGLFTLGLGVLALAPRLVYLGRRPIWYDEAFSLLLARQSWPEIIRGTAADTMPPLYYFLLNLWLRLGSGIAFARALNVLLGAAAVFVIWRWLAQAVGEREGRLAAVLAALSPFLIYHAQELRMYTLLLLGSALYGWGVTRLLQSDDTGVRSWLLIVGGGAVAMYSHNLALFTLAAPVVLLLLQRRWSTLVWLGKGVGAVLVLASPWLLVLPQQIAKIQAAFWTPTPGALEVLQALLVFHTNLPLPDWAIPVAVFGLIMTLFLVGYTLLQRRREIQQLSLLAAFLLLPPVGLLAASYLMRPVFVARAFILSAVAYYGVVAWAAWRESLPGLRFVLPTVVLLPALLVLPAQYRYHSFPRSPFDRAAEFLRSHVERGEVVVHDNKLSSFPIELYAPELPASFIRDEPGSHNDTLAPATQQVLGLIPEQNISRAVGDSEVVWFVVLARAEQEYREMGRAEHPRITWLRERYQLRGKWSFNDLNIYQFERGG